MLLIVQVEEIYLVACASVISRFCYVISRSVLHCSGLSSLYMNLLIVYLS